MSDSLVERILAEMPHAAQLYSRLVLVVGPPGSGKTSALQEISRRAGYPYVNLNLELCRRLLELPERQRPLRVPALLQDTLPAAVDAVLLDNTEVLFDLSLKQDPLRCLLGVSRDRTVVAAWNGVVEDMHLLYATYGHPEHRRHPLGDLLVVQTGPASGT